jgi:hypothetical protein
MDQQQFVDALKAQAAVAAVEDTVSQCLSPRGRRPSQEWQDRSAWFNALSAEDQEMVIGLAREVAEATLFGVLCILDGSRRIETGNAHIQLARVEGGCATLLASSDLAHKTGNLHELL